MAAEELHQLCSVINGIRRIGQDDVEGVLGQPLDKADGVTPVYRHPVAYAEGSNIALQCFERRGIQLHEGGRAGPA